MALTFPSHAGKIHDAVAKRDLAALNRALKAQPVQIDARLYPDFEMPLPTAAAIGDPVITGSVVPLCCGAVTDREMRIPAVMSVRECLSHLQTGQRVRVDGIRGLVMLLGGEPHGE